eukprot:TRINITY_DN22793_c0_g1_i1.p1 TRINITY_DN22793_c0_g1~~TRINITY_DN22793_c0_g1_i1.p1  ORF type:complete len:229 (+),score=18.07 TRINITY_DN22793_c0_g1_i1:139-825(+)
MAGEVTLPVHGDFVDIDESTNVNPFLRNIIFPVRRIWVKRTWVRFMKWHTYRDINPLPQTPARKKFWNMYHGAACLQYITSYLILHGRTHNTKWAPDPVGHLGWFAQRQTSGGLQADSPYDLQSWAMWKGGSENELWKTLMFPEGLYSRWFPSYAEVKGLQDNPPEGLQTNKVPATDFSRFTHQVPTVPPWEGHRRWPSHRLIRHGPYQDGDAPEDIRPVIPPAIRAG